MFCRREDKENELHHLVATSRVKKGRCFGWREGMKKGSH